MAEASPLERVLDRARYLGFLGPGPIRDQIDHALRFGAGLDGVAASGRDGQVTVADLGAGGGLPSLPLLTSRSDLQVTLVDALQKRWAFQVWALVELGLTERAEAWCGRAEDLGHDPARRSAYDAVVARGFGPPSQTVECAAPLLRRGGRLLVSEPPDGRTWPTGPLAAAGLTELDRRPGVVVFERSGEVPDELPRPVREQRRRPLFEL